MEYRYISVEQFKGGLRAIGHSTIITIVAKVVPEMRKTLNPYWGKTHKVVRANGTIGADYERSVNRASLKQGISTVFIAGPHQWAEYVDSCFVRYPGDPSREYLRFQENFRSETFYIDNEEVSPTLIEPYLRQRQEELVKYRNFAVANVVSVTWGGTLYTLRHSV